MHTSGPRENVLTLLLFALALGLPFAGTRWYPGWARGAENRALALRPMPWEHVKDVEPWLRAWEAFMRDHFGGRDLFIRAFHRGHLALFGCSALPDVAVNRNGWLYYLGDHGREALRGTLPPDGTLDQWTTCIEDRSAWLKDRGIRYVFFAAPDKQSIYPEHLPPDVPRPAGRTRLDALMENLAARHVETIDLRPVLREARRDGLQYWTADSHWTHRAAYRAAEAVAERLATWNSLREAPPQRFEPEAPHECDLATMVAMGDVLRSPSEAPIPKPRSVAILDEVVASSAMPAPRVLVLHDSFGEFACYLESRVSTVARWTDHPDPEIVDAVRPDVVVQEVVERRLNLPPGEYSVVFGEDRASRRAFAAARTRRAVTFPLPPVSLPIGQHVVLRAVLERPETGLAVLTARAGSRRLHVQHQVRSGRSVIYLALGTDVPADDLQLTFLGHGPTNVVSLELATGLAASDLR